MSTESSAAETDKPAAGGVQADDNKAVDQPVSQGATGQSETTESAQSPGADDAKGPKTPLEAVTAALEPEKEDAESSAATGEGQQKPAAKEEGAKEPDAEATEEADKRLPFHQHPRWKQVTGENRKLKEERPALVDKAQRWDAIDAKFRQSGLAPEDTQPLFEGGARLKASGATTEELQNLMAVGAALKLGDRQVVMQIAKPVFSALGLDIVEVLPDDIRRRVEEGAISEEDARRTASAEFLARSERTRRELTEQSIDAERAHAERVASGQAMARAANEWEARVSAGDADWSRKQPFVEEEIKNLAAMMGPRTPDDAVKICQAALDRVNRIFKASGSQRRPEVTPTTGGTTATVAPAPKTPLEAVTLALGG